MKINRVADEKLVPQWVIGHKSVSEIPSHLSEKEFERISSMPVELPEDGMVSEREQIEVCASTGSIYHISSNWSNDTKSALKEYASVCGMDSSRFKEINPEAIVEDVGIIQSDISNSRAIKMAENMVSDKKTLVLNDPFKLDVEAKSIKDDNWQSVKLQSKLDDKPSIMTSAVKPVRGGEDYFTNPETKTARGQNSIGNADAIKTLAESAEEDTGARLRRENKERENQKVQKHQDWEKEKIEAMAGSEILPRGKVFPTELMNAQPGLSTPSSQMGVYAKFDPKDIPEKTAGESIKEGNEQKRKSIQRDVTKTEWQEVKSSSQGTISDAFAAALKKNLGK